MTSVLEALHEDCKMMNLPSVDVDFEQGLSSTATFFHHFEFGQSSLALSQYLKEPNGREEKEGKGGVGSGGRGRSGRGERGEGGGLETEVWENEIVPDGFLVIPSRNSLESSLSLSLLDSDSRLEGSLSRIKSSSPSHKQLWNSSTEFYSSSSHQVPSREADHLMES